jgi:hypothetical protein
MVKCYSVKKQTKEPFAAALRMQGSEICERSGVKDRGRRMSSLFSYLIRIFKGVSGRRRRWQDYSEISNLRPRKT